MYMEHGFQCQLLFGKQLTYIVNSPTLKVGLAGKCLDMHPPPPRHHTGVIRRDPSVCSAGNDPHRHQSAIVNERPLREFFNNQLVSFSDLRHFSIYTVDILQEVVIIVLDVELHVIPVVHWKRKKQFRNLISRYNWRSSQHNVTMFHYWGSVYNYSVLFLLEILVY